MVKTDALEQSPLESSAGAEVDRVLAGGGRAGSLARSVDWSKTALGPVEAWSPALRSAASLVLHNRSPMLLCWRPKLVQISNEACRTLLGDAASPSIGLPLRESAAEISEIAGPLADKLLLGGEVTATEDVRLHLRAKGPYEEAHLRLTCSPVPDQAVHGAGIGGVLITITDLTPYVHEELTLARAAEDRRLEKARLETVALVRALSESRARADYSVRLSGIGFWYCDLPFDELRWDERVKEHFFLPPEARVTIDVFYERILPEDRGPTRAAIETSIRDHSVYDVVYRTHEPVSGRVKWIRAMGGTAYAADGAPIRFDGVTVDISTQKLDEARLAASAALAEESSRAKDEFLAMLGHELRNPLAPISTAIHLLKLRSGDVMQRELAVIDRQTKHITRLVDDLLDVARIAAGKVSLNKDSTEIADVVAAAIETATPAIENGRHELVVSVPRHGLVVDVDRGRMTQVVANLLTNAAKYMPPGGRIGVAVRREGGEVVLSVEDTGIGIPAELLPEVFDLFVQGRQRLDRTQGGLGLGLALVKNLVAMHGGSVSARSDGPGRGSTFVVRLPSINARVRRDAAPQPLAIEAASGHRPRVLIVDDNEDGAEMLSGVVERMGYQTSVANDGPEALEKADVFLPVVALLDIGLPVMDGYELAERLRALWPELKLVAITGYGQETDRKLAKEAGFHAHLTKPVDLERLRIELKRLSPADATSAEAD